MATSGSFNTNSVGSFYFTVSWNRYDYSSIANEHYIRYTVTAHNAPSKYRTVYLKSLTINGTSKYYDTSGVAYYDGNTVVTDTMTIPSSNDAGDGSIAISFEAGVGMTPGSNCSGSDSWSLDRIPRYPTGCSISFSSKTVNSIKLNWSCNDNCKQVQYRLNGGSWVNTMPGNTASKTGSFNITGLQPNTEYLIEADFQRADSDLWSSHNTPPDIPSIKVKTYNIATVSVGDFNFGDTIQYSVSNPSGNAANLTVLFGETQITSHDCSYVIDFQGNIDLTQIELDNLYKCFGNNNSITLTFKVKTANNNNYINSQNVICTLTGNQKTSHIKVNGSWKRGKTYIKVNNNWKQGVIWEKVNGVWKRCI